MSIDPKRLASRASQGLLDPRSIPGLIVWYDASDLTTLRSDTAGSTPITTTGTTCAYIRNKVTNATTNATNALGANAGARPVYRQAGSTNAHPTLSVLEFNSPSNMTSTFSLGSAQTWFLVAQPSTTTGAHLITHYNSADAGNQPAITSGFSQGTTNNSAAMPFEIKSTNVIRQSVAPAGLTGFHVLGMTMASAGTHTARRNGVEVSRRSVATSFPSTSTHVLGNRGDANSYATYRFAEALYFDRVLSEAECAAVESYLGGKWAVSLVTPPTVAAHAEVQNWVNRVYLNGGTVSSDTISAAATFCAAIDSAGVRSSLNRVNLFAGDNLAACLVPLYRGVSSTSAADGFFSDTNNGPFVSGDYSESGGGLVGDGSTKWLNTGVPLNFSSTRHLGVYLHTNTTVAALRYMIGAAGSANASFLTLHHTSTTAGNISGFNSDDASTISTLANSAPTVGRPLICTSNPGAAGYIGYNNGTAFSTQTAYSTASTGAITVFALKRDTSSTVVSTTVSHSRLAGYTIGQNLTSSQVSSLNTAWTNFNIALGRAS
jgi:hypothetical protein